MTATTRTDIAAFITAQLDAEEAAARAALQPERWESVQGRGNLRLKTGAESMGWEFGGGSGVWNCDDDADDCDQYRAHAFNEADHIARHDPARVLATVAALRAVVELHAVVEGNTHYYGDDLETQHGTPACAACGYPGEYAVRWPCPTLRALASIWKDADGWQEEWR